VGLLQEIIEGAQRDSLKVSELLRSLQVVARRSSAPDLADWVQKERDGYLSDDEIPDYRGPHNVRVLADFAGPFNSQIRNLDIGPSAFPEYYSHGFSIEFRQSIAEIEDLLDGGDSTLSMPWPGDLIGMANGLIDRGDVKLVPMHGLVAVERQVPRSLLLRVTDRVRGRILDMALELEALDPDLGSAAGVSAAASPEAVSAIYQTVIHAGQAFIGENTTQIQAVNVTPGDADSLRRYLEGLGLQAKDSAELVRQAQESKPDGDKDGKLKSLISRVVAESGKLAPDVAKALIDAAIAKWTGA
jgi:hypothetical protein